MKKKFDFTAEMNEAQIPLNDPKNDFLEEEKQLLEKNAQRIANLNKNVEILYDSITEMLKFLEHYKLSVSQNTINQAEKFSNEILERFAKEINVRCAETEQRITKTEEFIFISHKTFYILIVLLLTFFSFFIIMIMENTEILHSRLVWKTIAYCGLIAVAGIGMVILLTIFCIIFLFLSVETCSIRRSLFLYE